AHRQKLRSEQDSLVGNTCSVLVDLAKYDGIAPNLDFVSFQSVATAESRANHVLCLLNCKHGIKMEAKRKHLRKPIDRLFKRLLVVRRVFCGRLFQCNLRFRAPTHAPARDIDLFRESTFDVDYTKFKQSVNRYQLLSQISDCDSDVQSNFSDQHSLGRTQTVSLEWFCQHLAQRQLQF
ncbi:hypothetical protein X801_03732, partial [Opisthorchis viverrini]